MGRPTTTFLHPQTTPSLSRAVYLVRGPELSPHLLRPSGAHVRFEVHQATGLCLQEAVDPLSRILSTIPALHFRSMHSAVGGHRVIGRDNLEALSIVNTVFQNGSEKLHWSNRDAAGIPSSPEDFTFSSAPPPSNCLNPSEFAFPFVCLISRQGFFVS